MKLVSSKETVNKLRWEVYVKEDATFFYLYILKWRVPQPWPSRIFVSIREWQPLALSGLTPVRARSGDLENVIRAAVRRVSRHTRTIRFAALGDPKDIEIGDPYIPFSLLPSGDPQKVIIEISWDLSSKGEFSEFRGEA